MQNIVNCNPKKYGIPYDKTYIPEFQSKIPAFTNQVSELMQEVKDVCKLLLQQRQANLPRLQHVQLCLEEPRLLDLLLDLRLLHLKEQHRHMEPEHNVLLLSHTPLLYNAT